MEYISIILLAVIVSVGLLLSFFVISSDKKSKINRAFFAVATSILIWNVFGFLANRAVSDSLVLLYYKINYGAVSLFLIFFYYFTLFFPTESIRRRYWLDHLIALIGIFFTIISIATPWIAIKAEIINSTQIQVTPGVLSNFFYVFATLLVR